MIRNKRGKSADKWLWRYLSTTLVIFIAFVFSLDSISFRRNRHISRRVQCSHVFLASFNLKHFRYHTYSIKYNLSCFFFLSNLKCLKIQINKNSKIFYTRTTLAITIKHDPYFRIIFLRFFLERILILIAKNNTQMFLCLNKKIILNIIFLTTHSSGNRNAGTAFAAEHY